MYKYIQYYLFLLLIAPAMVLAQGEEPSPMDSQQWLQVGEVIEVQATTYPMFGGREVEFQHLSVELDDGSVRTDVYNDYTPVNPGTTVYLAPSYNPATDTEGLFVEQVDRVWQLGVIIAMFVVVYLLIGGWRGARSLFALVAAMASVYFVLIPALQAGQDPLWVGVGIAALILGLAMFITHGFTIVSLVSYAGSMIAIVCTVLFAIYAMSSASISGLVGNEASTLALVYGPTLDTWKLLLAAMIIGILGVMDDVAVMQAAMVREFFATNPQAHTKEVFARAMRVGREHAAALVNTLVLAYTAVALPLLLVVFSSGVADSGYDVPWQMHLSNELFVVEIIRSIVGSFGLVLTVPIVTLLAVFFFSRYRPKDIGTGHVCAHHHH